MFLSSIIYKYRARDIGHRSNGINKYTRVYTRKDCFHNYSFASLFSVCRSKKQNKKQKTKKKKTKQKQKQKQKQKKKQQAKQKQTNRQTIKKTPKHEQTENKHRKDFEL